MSFKRKQWIILGSLIIVLIVLFSIILKQNNIGSADLSSSFQTKKTCNIGVITVSGFLNTEEEDDELDSLRVAQAIRSLAFNSNYIAVVLLIDSRGGSATAAEEIGRAIDEIDLPVVAFVRGSALSGAYWVAASTDYIVALETSTIGSIGVNTSYLQETDHNQKEGYAYQEIVSGEYKNVGNSYKVLSEKHKKYLQEYTNDIFGVFKDVVMRKRNLSEQDFSKVADGKFFIAKNAVGINLVDKIGGIPEVKEYLSGVTATEKNRLLLCEPTKI